VTTAALTIDLTATAAATTCAATYEQIPAIQVQVSVRADGKSVDPAAVVVSCPDGSAGRVVLPARESGQAELPQPLTFADKAVCTVSLSDDTTRPRTASLVVQPAPGNAPLSLPATVSLDKTGTSYELAVTLTYDTSAGQAERKGHTFASFSILPVALIGSGLVGIGAVLLLVLVVRRRMGLD
jgi:hypothetical protein